MAKGAGRMMLANHLLWSSTCNDRIDWFADGSAVAIPPNAMPHRLGKNVLHDKRNQAPWTAEYLPHRKTRVIHRRVFWGSIQVGLHKR